MATVKEYIDSKVSKFGFVVSDAELDIMLEAQQLSRDAPMAVGLLDKVNLALVSIIPELLLIPDISEGQFSQKYNAEGIKAYYKMLCTQLGIEDKLDPQPKVRDRSNIW